MALSNRPFYSKRFPAFSRRNLFVLLAAFLVLAAPHAVFAAKATLAWNANQEADIKGYNLYVGTESGVYSTGIDVGNVTTYTISNLDDTRTTYFALTAYNKAGQESPLSSEVWYAAADGSSGVGPGAAGSDAPSVPTTTSGGSEPAQATATESGGGGGGGGCFIATAVYGADSREVYVLRQFRDHHLLTNRPGRAFVRLYYTYSPPIAKIMAGSLVLRTAGRMVVGPIEFAVEHGSIFLFVVGAAIVAAGSAAGSRIRRRREARRK